MKPAIRVENLSKLYHLGALQSKNYHTLRETLTALPRSAMNRFSAITGRSKTNYDDPENLWALKDVSFDVQPGEVVGVIGRNGAGKSTLLKILSRIVEPTSGRAELRGRLGSLLEVGTGFHTELTGRENIFLNGAILGMTRHEIRRKFDEIVAFAEIEKFLDTPVKRYSSGMYVRLAFAVAAHLELETLMVDEVLAVGDAAFQKKCMGKIGEVATGGRTVLLVSHNMAAIQNLCEKTLVLSKGKAIFVGKTAEGVQQYLAENSGSVGGDVDLNDHDSRRANCLPLLKRVRLVDQSGKVKDRFLSGESMTVELTFDPAVYLPDPQFGIGVDDWTGTRIFSLATYLSCSQLPAMETTSRVGCYISELPLGPGRYTLSLNVGSYQNPNLDVLESAVAFDVDPTDYFGNGRLASPALGRVLVRSSWEKVCEE